MRHIPLDGYEDAAFSGRNCHPCLHPEDKTPYEAAVKFAARFKGSYIIEEEDGWTVFAPVTTEGLSPEDQRTLDEWLADPEVKYMSKEDRKALDAWLKEPIEQKIARWELEMLEGKRDQDGRWIGEPRLRQSKDRGQTE